MPIVLLGNLDTDRRSNIQQKVTVLEWVEGLYEEQVFVGDTKIESSMLESLDLRVDRVLTGR